MVNRGYVDNPNPDASLKPIAVPDGAVEIVGVLRWPEQPGWFVTPYSERQDLWFVRDHRCRWLAALRLGRGGAVLHRAGKPGAARRRAAAGPLTVKLRNDHLGYALTWFGLAAVLLGVFGFWARSRSAQAPARLAYRS